MTQNLIQQWLRMFQRCIRNRDYVNARKLFHTDVKAFGVRSVALGGIDAMENLEWKEAWPEQLNFTFDHTTLNALDFGAAGVLCVKWHSRSNIVSKYVREGRATFILHLFDAKKDTKHLLCVHSHISMNPE